MARHKFQKFQAVSTMVPPCFHRFHSSFNRLQVSSRLSAESQPPHKPRHFDSVHWPRRSCAWRLATWTGERVAENLSRGKSELFFLHQKHIKHMAHMVPKRCDSCWVFYDVLWLYKLYCWILDVCFMETKVMVWLILAGFIDMMVIYGDHIKVWIWISLHIISIG